MTVDVKVGEGVSVARVGVADGVRVSVGWAAAVRVAAAFAVWAINWFTWFGFAVGKGVANDGTHAIMSARIANQNRNFVFRVDMFPLPHPKSSGRKLLWFFYFDRDVWIADSTFHNKGHDVCAFLFRSDRIQL